MLAFTISWMVAALAGVASARPASLESRDVVAPPIIYPTAGTVWRSGQKQHVDWDTSKLPPYQNITNKEGMIVLGYLDKCDPDAGEHLDLDNYLAKGFNISAGSVDVTVPTVQPRNDYILVLFGDSGNLSPKFTINVAITGHQSDSAFPSACGPTSTTSGRASSSSSSLTAAPTTTTSPVGTTTTVSGPPVTVTSVSSVPTTLAPPATSGSPSSSPPPTPPLETVTSFSTSFVPASASSSSSFLSFSATSPLQFGSPSTPAGSAAATSDTNDAAALRGLGYGSAAIAALVAVILL